MECMTKKKAKAAPVPAQVWKNRIVAHAEVPAKSLTAHPQNYRIHPDTQRAAVSEAITRLGWLEEVLVNRTSGRILNGHLRVELAAARGETVPVSYVELSEQDEALALGSLDPLGGLAVEDSERLAELLSTLELGSSVLDTMLSTNAQDAQLSRLFDDTGDDDTVSTGPRLPGFGQNITIVIPAKDLALFERAVRATDKMNRGEAVAEICREYLSSLQTDEVF
jgi:hypothetical protein